MKEHTMKFRWVPALFVTLILIVSCAPIVKHKNLADTHQWFDVTINATGEIRQGSVTRLDWGLGEVIDFPPWPETITDASLEATDTSFPIEDPPPPVGECKVLDAQIIYGARAHIALDFPTDMSAPQPGLVLSGNTGTSSGAVPMTNPQSFREGDNFEYHSDLNGIHGCSSRQMMQELVAMVHKQTGAVGHASGNGYGQNVPFQPDTDASYLGNTRTGTRNVNNATIYEGTKDVIHWVDAPGKESVPDANTAAFAAIYTLLLKSITYDGNGQTGKLCLTGQTIIIDIGTGRNMPPAGARQMMNNLQPNGGNNAQQALKDAARVLKTAPANGGYQGRSNPEFRQLGCYPF